MIAASLGSLVLVGVLSAFLMLGRSGANLSSYAQMDAESRRAIETLSQDLRMASVLSYNSSSSVTLTVPDSYPSSDSTQNEKVTYAYDSAASGATARCFYVMAGDASSTAAKRILVRNVTALTFRRYDRLDAATTSSTNTKRVELAMTLRATSNTAVSTTNYVVSASIILRNKPVI
ncbi:MAG: hypothetical protein HY302_16310 [Opitutae bacterium]|nr:hypothetical protein [Opitutae bacterium]